MSVVFEVKLEIDKFREEHGNKPTAIIMTVDKAGEMLNEMVEAGKDSDENLRKWAKIVEERDVDKLLTCMHGLKMFGVTVHVVRDYMVVGTPQ